MKFRILVVGKVRSSALAPAIADYESRATRYWPLDVIELREESVGEPARVRQREGERLLGQAAGSSLVVCDEGGRSMTSVEFAEWLMRRREAARDVSVAIGGAFGLDPAVRDAAEQSIALAPWTLPHELARLVLAEQFYRAGTIVRREPYHK